MYVYHIPSYFNNEIETSAIIRTTQKVIILQWLQRYFNFGFKAKYNIPKRSFFYNKITLFICKLAQCKVRWTMTQFSFIG